MRLEGVQEEQNDQTKIFVIEHSAASEGLCRMQEKEKADAAWPSQSWSMNT